MPYDILSLFCRHREYNGEPTVRLTISDGPNASPIRECRLVTVAFHLKSENKQFLVALPGKLLADLGLQFLKVTQVRLNGLYCRLILRRLGYEP